MHRLKDRLNVSYIPINTYLFSFTETRRWHQGPTVTGNINLTCDAWQASNMDGYFAVTGHWVEEKTKGKWSLQSGLLGFVQMNTAHNGVRLGQALYKVCKRLSIVHRVRLIFLECWQS